MGRQLLEKILFGEFWELLPMPILNSKLRGETLLEQPCIGLRVYSRRKKDQGMKNQPPATHQTSHPSVCTLE